MRWIGPMLLAAALLALQYLGAAFYEMQFDPSKWDQSLRGMIALSGGMTCVLCMCGWIRGID